MTRLDCKAPMRLGRLAACLLVAVACLMVAGCAQGAPDAASSSAGTAESAASAYAADGRASEGMQTVTDCAGRTVQVPLECKRIAALDSFAGEALVMSGAGPYMVAAPRGVSSDVVLRQMYPDLVDLPAPISGGTVNVESLLSLKPDVALVKASLYYSSDEIAKLDKLGIPYLVVGYQSVDEQIAALEMVGCILPEEQSKRMNAIVGAFRDAVARVDACAAKVPESEAVKVYHSINLAVLTDGASSVGADWIERVGAVDVSAGEAPTSAQGDYRATLEQVFLWDPDVVICNEATTADYFLSDSKWTGLRAVMEKQVYTIPIGATRWGQRGSVETWFAMMWLGKLVYPEYYADIDLHEEVVAFYGDVLGVQVDDDLYDQMISGRDMRKKPTQDSARN